MNDTMCSWCKTVIRLTAGELAKSDATGCQYHPECIFAAIEYGGHNGFDDLDEKVLQGPGIWKRGKPELLHRSAPKATFRRIS
jgi:hypothetical protein